MEEKEGEEVEEEPEQRSSRPRSGRLRAGALAVSSPPRPPPSPGRRLASGRPAGPAAILPPPGCPPAWPSASLRRRARSRPEVTARKFLLRTSPSPSQRVGAGGAASSGASVSRFTLLSCASATSRSPPLPAPSSLPSAPLLASPPPRPARPPALVLPPPNPQARGGAGSGGPVLLSCPVPAPPRWRLPCQAASAGSRRKPRRIPWMTWARWSWGNSPV